MTTTNAELRTLAEKAGLWPPNLAANWSCKLCGQLFDKTPSLADHPDHGSCIFVPPIDQADAAYIAAADPARIIELLDELEQTKAGYREAILENSTALGKQANTLRAKLDQYEQPTRELALKAEPTQTLTQTLISLNLAQVENRDLRAKLEIALRALEFYADPKVWHHANYEDIDYVADEDAGETAREALAQVKEQP